MKAKELRKSTVAELQSSMLTSQRGLFDLRLKLSHSTNRDDQRVLGTHNVRAMRRTIARIKTVLNEKMREIS